MIAFWIFTAIVLLFGFVVFFGSPYVPTLRSDMRLAFDELYVLSKKDLVVDLGSGDGVILREASRRGARAVGIELNPALVLITRLLSLGDKKVSAHTGNLRSFVLPRDTTLVYVFANTRHTEILAKRIIAESKRLKRPLNVMTYGAELPLLELVAEKGAHHLYKTSLQ